MALETRHLDYRLRSMYPAVRGRRMSPQMKLTRIHLCQRNRVKCVFYPSWNRCPFSVLRFVLCTASFTVRHRKTTSPEEISRNPVRHHATIAITITTYSIIHISVHFATLILFFSSVTQDNLTDSPAHRSSSSQNTDCCPPRCNTLSAR